MKGVMLEVPQAMLDERRRLGLDKLDEMWDGIVHMVPPAGFAHVSVNTDLLLVLAPLARERGLRPLTDAIGLCGADDDWRVPDQVHARPDRTSESGVEVGGAAFVVEVRSPHDETPAKLPWYAAFGVDELLWLDPVTRTFQFYENKSGAFALVEPGLDGEVRSTALAASFQTIAGPRLLITWAGGRAEV